jgi:glycosyltransferase involved in cell wall biosynthesis
MNTLSDTTVSVVIATRNRVPMLKTCIDSIRGQTYPKELTELVVVDDGSTDGTLQYLKKLSSENPSVKIITQAHGWQSQARNEGIRASRGNLIAIVDDDCTLEQDWLLRMVEAMQDDQVYAVNGHVQAPGESLVVRFLDYICALNPALLPNGDPKYIVTADVLFRRKALHKIGLFDEAFASSGGEDVEISLRMRRKRMKFKFLPDAQVSHWYRPSVTDFLRRYYRYGYGARLAFDKHLAWDHWIPEADVALQGICKGERHIREFVEVEDINLRLWFCILHVLKRFCFVAGYTHLADLTELDSLHSIPTAQPSCKDATSELTAALLAGLSEQPTALYPTGKGWNSELRPLEPYYQAAIEKRDMRTWVRSVSQLLDWNYVLKLAACVSLPSISYSLPDENLSPLTKSLWLGYQRYREITYQRKFRSVANKLHICDHSHAEMQRLCHVFSVDVNRFREWYGGNFVCQNDTMKAAIWPFWRRPKPRTPSYPYPNPGEGPGYW